MNVALELFNPDIDTTPPEAIEWILTIDGKPYPCEEKCVMNYADALNMIELAYNIEGTIDD